MYPEKIELVSDTILAIKWNDGEEQIYEAEKLRGKCPCARCKEKEEPKASPFKVLKANPNNVTWREWSVQGRYAIRFTFSDGHGDGIYGFEMLRELGE